MEAMVISGLFNAAMAFLLFLVKGTIDDLKQQVKDQRVELNKLREDNQKSNDTLRDTYFKKEDFREFKEELWERLRGIDGGFKNIEATIDKKLAQIGRQ